MKWYICLTEANLDKCICLDILKWFDRNIDFAPMDVFYSIVLVLPIPGHKSGSPCAF